MASGGFMSSSSMGENKYWITGKDIHKKIITSMIQVFLGPEATVRSYTNNGEDGFLISTPGDCLTDEQIDEICKQSKQMWERQAADRRPSAGGLTTGLKRPLHKPVVISRARPRSSSSNTGGNQNRRPLGHRGSFHSTSLQQPQQRSRHSYGHISGSGQQYTQPQAPRQYPSQGQNHFDQHQPSHYAQQSYSSYDAPREAGDERYSPYHQGHRRQQRSFSGSQNDYPFDAPWGELPTPIGPPSSTQANERRESIQS
ncbi:hypothetical protein F503_06112 [Ophiostoma piceae UAMH 11346]|uniref:Uncharacterized protein n=1 Tax=Ophiostoma piceae (strain UAMH 11346) TaxID=1262450 RepID=S3BS63_OPHP1|nr:hypothetical protein F503_06112 [Ophiostoma piceae UAMH 11346]